MSLLEKSPCRTFPDLSDCKVWQTEKKCPGDCPYNNFPVKLQGYFSSEKGGSLSKKEKRAFQRLVTGLSIGNHQNAYMRFMTLTSSPDSPDINKSFDILKKRILRAHVRKDGFHGFKFNRYFKLKTAEGHNVLHIIYWGLFIPVEWLKRTWDEIHGAFKVDIRACWDNKHRKMNRVNGLVGYLLTNYLTKQPILRMSYGWKWAWLGFCKSWRHIKITQSLLRISPKQQPEPRTYFPFKYQRRSRVIEYWNFLMKDPLPTSRQIKFCNPDFTRYKRGWF